ASRGAAHRGATRSARQMGGARSRTPAAEDRRECRRPLSAAPSAMLHSEFISAPDKNSTNLWIMLHGLGDSIEGSRSWPEEMQLPWMNYLLVNAPDKYYSGYSWFDFTGDPVPGVQRSRGLLFELLDAQRAKGFATERTILGGFSQGCVMSIDVGLRYPHRLAG